MTDELQFRPMSSAADAEAFRLLNEEWIVRHFRLEEKDRKTLSDPEGEIVARGGHVFVAVLGAQVVGCAALLAFPERRFELSKMAVAPEMRGAGLGRKLLIYVLEQARALGARDVFLGSSTKLENAVHLYESCGFRHVPTSELPYLGYERADVFMLHDLN